MENEKDTTLTAITSGSKYFSNVRSPAISHKQTLSNPFRNLTNKVRGKIFYKEVFLRLLSCVRRLFLRLNYYCIGMYPAYICIFQHESADDYITIRRQTIWGWGSCLGVLGNIEYYIFLTPRPLWLGLVVFVCFPSMGQIKLSKYSLYLKQFNCVQTVGWHLFIAIVPKFIKTWSGKTR